MTAVVRASSNRMPSKSEASEIMKVAIASNKAILNQSPSEKITKTEIPDKNTYKIVTDMPSKRNAALVEQKKRNRPSFFMRVLFRRSADELQAVDHHQSSGKSTKRGPTTAKIEGGLQQTDAGIGTGNHQSRLVEWSQRSNSRDPIAPANVSAHGQKEMPALECDRNESNCGSHATKKSERIKWNRSKIYRSNSAINYVPYRKTPEESRPGITQKCDNSDHAASQSCPSTESLANSQIRRLHSVPITVEKLPRPAMCHDNDEPNSDLPVLKGVPNIQRQRIPLRDKDPSKSVLVNGSKENEVSRLHASNLSCPDSEDQTDNPTSTLLNSPELKTSAITRASNFHDLSEAVNYVLIEMHGFASDDSSFLKTSNGFELLPHLSPSVWSTAGLTSTDEIFDNSSSASKSNEYSEKNNSSLHDAEAPVLCGPKDNDPVCTAQGIVSSPPVRRANPLRRRWSSGRRSLSVKENNIRLPLEQILEDSCDDASNNGTSIGYPPNGFSSRSLKEKSSSVAKNACKELKLNDGGDSLSLCESIASPLHLVSFDAESVQPSVSTEEMAVCSENIKPSFVTEQPVETFSRGQFEKEKCVNEMRTAPNHHTKVNASMALRLESDSKLLAKNVRSDSNHLKPITGLQDNQTHMKVAAVRTADVNATDASTRSSETDVNKADMNPTDLERAKLTRMSSLRMFWVPSGAGGKLAPSPSFSAGDLHLERSERLKDRLLRKREQWRERRQSSGRDIAKGPPASRRDCGDTKDIPGPVDVSVGRDTKDGSMEDVSVGSGGGDGGKLSRWFSLRKSNNSEAGERKTSNQGGGTSVPQSAGHPLAGGKGTVTSGKPSSVLKEACDESDAMFSASSDCGSQHHRNSSTLSTASFSSSSSSSTTSSLSSLPPTTPSGNPNSQPNNPKLPQLTELEERMSELDAGTNASNFYLHSCGGLGSLGASTFQRKHQPPNLSPMPPGLTPEQIKRRHIVASIVHSENNYVATLHRLVRDYRKPLEESKPPILSQSKVAILFHYVHELLQCHTLFRIALTDCVRHWDRDEKIGDVFFACFSKSVVLEIYSEFINNFTRAMELAKLESRKKSIFADFLKMRQIASPDRLSFFGMMVKPVQRFPQFILFLQDLLKHTPKGHPDRMSLQLALTQLESLAETLNELKRESEQHQAFKATLKQINSKFALRSISEGNRCLIRQDDATKLEFGPNGLIKQTKERRLFLTTDAVICVSVVPKTSDDINSHERLSLKWVHPITEIEVQENNSSLTLSRLLAAGLAQRTSGTATSSLGKTTSTGGGGSSVYENIYGSVSTSTLMESEAMVGAICAEMNDLMHDYQVVSRIAGLVSSLKGSYDALSATTTQGVLDVIQQNIQARDDRMSWLDGCCLQIKAGKDVMTFHVQDPGVKKDWIIELRLAQLAVSSVNSPAWDTGDSDTQRPPSRRPLFVTALPLLHASHHTQVVCGCQYPLLEVPKNVPLKSVVAGTRRRRGKTSTSVWICSTDGVTSYVTRYVTHLGGLRECGRASLHELCVTGMLHVPPSPLPPVASSPLTPTSPTGPPHPLLTDRPSLPLSLDTVWIGTLQNRLLVYSGSAHDSQEELNSTELPAAVSSLIYHCHMVFVGLTNGSLLVYHRSPTDGCWLLSAPDTIELSAGAAVSALLPLSAQLYAAVADNVVVVDCASLTVLKRLSAHHGGTVSLLAHSGIGLWLSEEGSSTVCLYHTESCRHLQDIDLAPSVSRMLGVSASVVVTALVISRGLLWVGTSLGVTVTLPLPRLQGVPIISGRPTLSCHAHTGPVTFLMTLMTPEYYTLPRRKAGSVPPESMSSDKEVSWESATSKTPDGDSCSEGAKQVSVKRAHTLPRGFGGSPGTALGEDMGPSVPGDEGAVLGLCGDLLRHWSDEGATEGTDEGQENDLRRSDPSLSSMGSTLDRRLRLRDGRPRSLDLSCASIDSKISAVTTTSSGSDDSSTVHTARRGTIKEDCVDSGRTNDRDGAGTLEKMAGGCLNTTDVDTEHLECNRNVEANPGDEVDHLNKNSVCGVISQTSASDKSNKEKIHPVESNYGSTEDSSAIDNTAEALSTNEVSSGNRAAGDSIKDAAGDAETLENRVIQLESSDNTIPGCGDDVAVDIREDKSAKISPGSAKKPKKSVLTASEDVDAIAEPAESASSETKFTKGKRSITESLKSVTDAAKSISLTSSVEDVTRPKESQRRTHRRSSSDVTQPVSDTLPVNNRPKISLPAGPISSAVPGTQTSSQTRLSPSTSGKDVLNAPYSGTSLNRSLGTLSRSPTARSISKTGGGEPANAEPEQPRTVLVLTGGRGYKCIRDTAPTNGPPHNNTDAHILVWEMKL